MADHDDEHDYEFANAEDWETPAPRRKAKAPKAPQQPAPQQAAHQELREQLITIIPESTSTSLEDSGAGKWSAQAAGPGHSAHYAASSGPQAFNRGRAEAGADELPIKYGAFAVPALEAFEHPQPFPPFQTNYGMFPYNGTSEEPSEMLGPSVIDSFSGISGPSTGTYASDSQLSESSPVALSTQGPEYADSGDSDHTASDPRGMDGPVVYPSGFNFLNVADVRERQGSNPDGRFTLDSQRHNDFDRRFFGPRNNNLNHVAKKTGTHLSMPRDVKEPVIEMWGTPEQITAAKQLLMDLVHLVNEEIDRAEPRVGGWAKVRAGVSARRQAHLEDQAKKARIRRAFRREPPDGTQFGAVGVFVWPSREINPQSTLGMNLEHLDSIRYEHEVYIIWNRKRRFFRILGADSGNVDKAVDRIYGCFCETAAKNRKPNRMILVEPPSGKMRGVQIRMTTEHDLRDRQIMYKNSHPGIQLSLVGPSPSKQFLQIWQEKSIVIAYANDAYMRRTIQQGLIDVAYFRGHVRLKFYIGKLVLFGYRKSSDHQYDLLEYIHMARNPQMEGELIRYLGNKDMGVTDEEVARTAIERMSGAPDTFAPVDFNEDFHFQDSLEHVLEPQISATFELKMFDGTGKSVKIRLEVAFVRESNTEKYTISEHRWLMSPKSGFSAPRQQDKNRRSPVDIIVQDLESEIAYQMELSTWEVLPDTDIYPIFDQFLRHCSVEVIPDEHNNNGTEQTLGNDDEPLMIKRVIYANLPGLSVSQMTQKTKHRFWLTGCSYRHEITKYEYLPTDEVLDLYPDGITISFKGVRAPADVRWGAAMDNATWENELRQQMSVPIGTRGTWDTDVDSFFSPTDCKPVTGGSPDWRPGDGFEECIVRAKEFMLFLKKVQSDVAAAKAIAATRDRDAQLDNESTYGGPEEYDM